MPFTKIGSKILIGWDEYCALPEMGIPVIRAKIDTGAKTSALHAFDIKPFKENGREYVRFKTWPVKGRKDIVKDCVAPLADKRRITSSNGEKEKRYIIEAELHIGPRKFKTEISLTSRHKMQYRMLLGREDLKKTKFVIDPAKSRLLGVITMDEQLDIYKASKKDKK